MTVNCNNCNILAPPQLHGVEQGEGVRTVRVAVRCRRPGCQGQLYVEPELGGHETAFVCLLCGRTAVSVETVDLVERHGITRQQMDAATWKGAAFVWHRIEATS